MRFILFILQNLRRHWIRNLIGAAGIGFGVAAMLTVLSIVLGAISMFERILSSDSHYLVFEKNVSDLFFSSVTDEQVDKLRHMDNVDAVYPMLFGIVSSENNPVITCFGVTREDPRIREATWITGGPGEFDTRNDRVYLGSRAAGFLEVKTGERVNIGKEEYIVGGVLSTDNGFEDGGVFMPLATAQAYFHREGFCSIVAVKLQDTNRKDAFGKLVNLENEDLMALENEEFSASYSQFKILSATSWAVGICAFLLGGMSVANTMLMSVFSRIREIAILMVCGFSKFQVAMMIMGESLILAVFGMVGGFASGFLLLEIMKNIQQFQGYIETQVSPAVVSGIILVALLTSLAGALFPAWHATRIQPASALRYE